MELHTSLCFLDKLASLLAAGEIIQATSARVPARAHAATLNATSYIRPSPFRTEDTPDMPEEEEERVVRAVHMESPDTVNTNREHYHDWIMQNLG